MIKKIIKVCWNGLKKKILFLLFFYSNFVKWKHVPSIWQLKILTMQYKPTYLSWSNACSVCEKSWVRIPLLAIVLVSLLFVPCAVIGAREKKDQARNRVYHWAIKSYGLQILNNLYLKGDIGPWNQEWAPPPKKCGFAAGKPNLRGVFYPWFFKRVFSPPLKNVLSTKESMYGVSNFFRVILYTKFRDMARKFCNILCMLWSPK